MKKYEKNSQNGITLVALVVTVVVLLILAGVTIVTLWGNNSIIKRAQEAELQTTIGREKEQNAVAMNEWKIEKSLETGKVFAIFMQEKMREYADVENVETITDNEVIVTYKSGNKYCLSDNKEPEEVCDDENPGVLEDIGNNKLQVNSIEDLLAVAYNANSGAETYEGKTIELGMDLDFQSNYSYRNPTTKYVIEKSKKEGRIGVSVGYVPDESGIPIKELLLNEEKEGFIPIGIQGEFKGNFDGKGKELKNIYINVDGGGINARFVCNG